MVRQRHPGSDRIPVVYVTTPPKGSPRKLAMEFARFLGLPPIKRSYNTTDIADAVCQILIEARVDLVLVDEIHNLNLATSAGEDMSDHLKYFTEHLPATFVYAGINVERSGLFTGVRGKQIAGRCVLTTTGPFPYQAEWKGLVATLEIALRLHRHDPGTLVRLDKYLHRRTGGMIGSLSHLVRAAALTAILDGNEAITRPCWTASPSTTPPRPRGKALPDHAGLGNRTGSPAPPYPAAVQRRNRQLLPSPTRSCESPRPRRLSRLPHRQRQQPQDFARRLAAVSGLPVESCAVRCPNSVTPTSPRVERHAATPAGWAHGSRLPLLRTDPRHHRPRHPPEATRRPHLPAPSALASRLSHRRHRHSSRICPGSPG